MSRCPPWLAGIGLALAAWSVQAESLLLARLDGDRFAVVELDAAGRQRRQPPDPALRTPLGSVWKLFVHAYLLDRKEPELAYHCQGQDREEVYCCSAGERIERARALVQSCGLYYAPARLGIDPGEWRNYWLSRGAPAWLQDVSTLRPQQQVPVLALLQQLRDLPAQQPIRAQLLDVLLQGDAPLALQLGSRLRIKTWSWHRDQDPEQRIGGFAGWLADGSPIWASASGTSQQVLRRYAVALDRALPTPPTSSMAGDCVEVAMFARYPIAAVRQNGALVAPGRLQGMYEVEFRHGTRHRIVSQGELVLSGQRDAWQLTARLEREDYVARVLQREAAAEPLAAARALALVIRSYLQQQGQPSGDCLRIDDSSATQRVDARPASAAARAAAAWSADLVLAGMPVRYHRDQPGPDRLAWTVALQQAAAGLDAASILSQAFPRADWASWDRPEPRCEGIAEAEAWLQRQRPRWRSRLDQEPGYSEVDSVTVCRLQARRPYADPARKRIHIRGLRTQQDRLDLTHEYLHLAFADHPRAQDEAFIEALTRQLLLESLP